MKKLLVIAAGVAGYVLGARAGRERYEQIKNQSTKVWNSPTVQHGVDEASGKAKQAASAAGAKATDAAQQAATKVTSTVKGGDDATTPASGPAAPAPKPAAPKPAAPAPADTEDEGPGPTAPGSPFASPSPAGPPTAADLDPGKP